MPAKEVRAATEVMDEIDGSDIQISASFYNLDVIKVCRTQLIVNAVRAEPPH